MQNGKILSYKLYFSYFISFTLPFKGFLLVIIIASLMAVATSNINAKFLNLTKGHKFLASILTTACMVLLFFAPFVYAMIELAKALKNLILI